MFIVGYTYFKLFYNRIVVIIKHIGAIYAVSSLSF